MAETTPSQVSISGLSGFVGETVVLSGWLYNKRSKGKLHFVQLRDGSGTRVPESLWPHRPAPGVEVLAQEVFVQGIVGSVQPQRLAARLNKSPESPVRRRIPAQVNLDEVPVQGFQHR